MIRSYNSSDLNSLCKIWLDANLEAHSFVPQSYWLKNLGFISRALPCAEVYVYEENGAIAGFIGIENGYVAGIFIRSDFRCKGIGAELINKAKSIYSRLTLNVFKKNTRAVSFYKRLGFAEIEQSIDGETGEEEILMAWSCTL